MVPQSSHAVTILIVEDNRIDARLISHAFKQLAGWESQTIVLSDCDTVLRYWRCQDPFTNAARPNLVVLDLNVAHRDGTEVLRTIRETDCAHWTPVFIFSASPVEISASQVRKANLEADGYFMKPAEVGTFLEVAQQIQHLYEAGKPDQARQATAI